MQIKTIADLKEALEQYDDNQPVLLMEQPNWPFEYSISGVIAKTEIADEGGVAQEVDDVSDDTVYILEGSQLEYGNKEAWRE